MTVGKKVEPVRQICLFKSCQKQMWKHVKDKCFYLPKARAQEWLRRVGRSELLSTPWSKLRLKVVCSDHFQNDAFTNSLRNKLNWNAVPNQFVESNEEPCNVEETCIGSHKDEFLRLSTEPQESNPQPLSDFPEAMVVDEAVNDNDKSDRSRGSRTVDLYETLQEKKKIKQKTPTTPENNNERIIKRKGLINMMNTCYINSTVQALFQVPEFIESLNAHKVEGKCSSKAECFACELFDLHDELESTSVGSAAPHCLLKRRRGLGGQNKVSFRVGIQQDVAEFVAAIQDELITCDPAFSSLFTGEKKDMFSCQACKYTYENPGYVMYSMTLPIRNGHGFKFKTLQECLKEYMQPSVLVGKHCPNEACKATCNAMQQPILVNAPDFLIIQFSRFETYFTNGRAHSFKSKNAISCPLEISLQVEGGEVKQYKLVSSVNHHGNSVSSGHYTCTTFHRGGSVLYNDDKVTDFKKDLPDRNDAYILLYSASVASEEGSIKPPGVTNCEFLHQNSEFFHQNSEFHHPNSEFLHPNSEFLHNNSDLSGASLSKEFLPRKLIFGESSIKNNSECIDNNMNCPSVREKNDKTSEYIPSVQSESNPETQEKEINDVGAVNVFKFAHVAEKLIKRKKKESRDFLKELNLTKKELTPLKQKMYSALQLLLKEINRLRAKYMKKKIEVPTTPKELHSLALRTLKEIVSPELYEIVSCQVHNHKRPPKGTRYSLDNKIFALTMFKASPKCYDLLKLTMKLPSRQTLTKLLNRVPFSTGVNPHSVAAIKSLVHEFIRIHLLSVLSWDETKLIEHLCYNALLDQIDGYVDYGHLGRRNEIANQALMFAFRGLFKRYKQPFSAYFVRGTTPTDILAQLIVYTIEQAFDAGIIIVCGVCDQAGTNIAALRKLGANENQPFIVVGNIKIVVVLDTPHEIKCFRTLLMYHPLQMNGNKIAKYEYIIEYYNYIVKDYPRLSPKLTIHHLIPTGKFLMRVYLAAQLLSYTTAAGMVTSINFRQRMMKRGVSKEILDDEGVLDKDALPTVKCILNIDNIFDSLNGSSLQPDKENKKYRTAISDASKHFELWEEMLPWLQSLRFLTKTGATVTTPTINSFIWTINGMKQLWVMLKCEGVEHFFPRDCQQDFVENIFGTVKQHQGDGHDPTVRGFISAIKTIIINRCVKNRLNVRGKNCEEDNTEILADMRSFLLTETSSHCHHPGREEEAENLSGMSCSDTSDCDESNLNNEEELEEYTIICTETEVASLMTQALAYVAGFSVKAMLRKVKCNNCIETFLTTEIGDVHYYIRLKDYGYDSGNNELHYCKDSYILIFGKLLTFVEETLKIEPHIKKLKETLVSKATLAFKKKMNFIGCTQHKQYLVPSVIEFVCRVSILWFCKRVNDAAKEKRLKNIEKLKSNTGGGSKNPRIAELQKLIVEAERKRLKEKSLLINVDHI